MITRDEYNKFVDSFDSNCKSPGMNRDKDDRRFGQNFIYYLIIEKKILNIKDQELFSTENREICVQIIEQRYLHPREQ